MVATGFLLAFGLVPAGIALPQSNSASPPVSGSSGDAALRKSFERFLALDLRAASGHTGLPQVEVFSDEEMLRAELGRRLFFDPLLSSNGATSCATCHQPAYGFSSPEAVVAGASGKRGRRNAPSLMNRRWGTSQFWDGRAESLEHQALEPIENPAELDSNVDEVLGKLAAHEDYPSLFDKAFADGITRTNLAAALATFERLLISGDSPIDRFVAAQASANLTRSERQGLWIYESKGRCWRCHSGPNYTDESFHNTGVSWGTDDLCRFEFTGDESHRGQFKTPTLRNVALTAPYMHDGSMATLRDVVEFYDRGGNDNPHLDPAIRPLELSEQEKQDLEAFLRALTGRHLWDE
jgi:cytochrome c peroxidase